MIRTFLFIVAILSAALFTQADVFGSDKADKKLVQFSGVVVSGDSLIPIPFTNISVRHTHRGSTSDFYGFFSFVAYQNDTVDFSAVGFKTTSYVIPDTLTTNRYSLIQVMTSDTIILTETIIYPWPTPDQFKNAFLTLEIPDDDYERAMRNLDLIEMRERMHRMPMDASMNYKNYIAQHTSRLYYAGQLPPNNLLNPIAWGQFIKAWQEGRFRR